MNYPSISQDFKKIEMLIPLILNNSAASLIQESIFYKKTTILKTLIKIIKLKKIEDKYTNKILFLK